MKHAYPLSVQDDRSLPEDYEGLVYIWDIDKTYLSTRFSSLRGLARIPVEFAIDKRAIVGMPEVLRGLRRGPGAGVACVPLYFISASPPFLRSVVENKMLRDGVEQDGIIFKDWLRTLLAGRPGRLWEQLGFKMIALLTGRLRRPLAREYLFGDDTEQDAEAFSLYARLLNHDLSASELEEALVAGGVPSDDRDTLHELVEQLPNQRGRVEKMFIHLEHRTPPQQFKKYGPHLIPVQGSSQLVSHLYGLGLVDDFTVQAVHEEIRKSKSKTRNKSE